MKAIDHLPVPQDFTIPLHITAAELENYRSGWQIESLGMMLNYKMNWVEWYAIREFVQNALDATGSATLLHDDQLEMSYIVDNGPGIILRHLFLGEQKGETEREVHCLRGRFGEGMKLGLLPLMRDGNRILIRTVGTDYHFAAVERTDPRGVFHQINMLSRPNTITSGTVIAIHGPTNCLDYKEMFAPMLAESRPDLVLLSVKGGPEEFDDCKIRQVFGLPGRIFVRDIYVCDLPALFGYNFWFEDTRSVLSTDRNEIKDRNYNFRKEFAYLMKASCKAFMEPLFTQLYSEDAFSIQGKPIQKIELLEWTVLTNFRADNLDAEDAMTIYEIILSLVGQEFSWSRKSNEQKILEHHRIADLRDKLPDFRDLLIKYNLIKDPKDLARAAELTNETVIISANDFRAVDLGGVEQDLANSLEIIHRELRCYCEQLSRNTVHELRDVRLAFYAGNFKGSEERVLGYFERSSRTVYIHVKNLISFHNTMRVFIHEISHADCDTCADITQEFEDAMERISANIIELVARGSCDVDALMSACREIDRNEREFFQVIEEKVLLVGNPFGLIRPEHVNPKDRDLLDSVFYRIAHGAFTDFYEIKPILWGFSPYANSYRLEWTARGFNTKSKSYSPIERERMTRAQIIAEDLKTLQKLGFDLPEQADNLTEEEWVQLIDTYPSKHTARELNPRYKLAQEDWNNPEQCLRLLLEHPSELIKTRNLAALLNLANVSRIGDTELWTGDPQILSALRASAKQILDLQHPAQEMIQQDLYSYPIKEELVEWSGRFGWLEVLKEALTAYAPNVRTLAIREIAEKKDEAAQKILWQEFPKLLSIEQAPKPLSALIRVLKENLFDEDLRKVLLPVQDHVKAVIERNKDEYEATTLAREWQVATLNLFRRY